MFHLIRRRLKQKTVSMFHLLSWPLSSLIIENAKPIQRSL